MTSCIVRCNPAGKGGVFKGGLLLSSCVSGLARVSCVLTNQEAKGKDKTPSLLTAVTSQKFTLLCFFFLSNPDSEPSIFYVWIPGHSFLVSVSPQWTSSVVPRSLVLSPKFRIWLSRLTMKDSGLPWLLFVPHFWTQLHLELPTWATCSCLCVVPMVLLRFSVTAACTRLLWRTGTVPWLPLCPQKPDMMPGKT